MTPAASPSTPLRLQSVTDGAGLELSDYRLVVAGYTGRDRAAVEEHIAELAAIGVPRPPSVPCFFDLDPALVTTGPQVEIAGDATSGEVEPVLVRRDGDWYIGVGSDHTDRFLERTDIADAKAACPKLLSPSVVRITGDVKAFDWDAMTVDSWVDGRPYQRGSLASVLPPGELLTLLEGALGDIPSDMVVFAGTVPLLDGEFVPGTRWRLALTAPKFGLVHAYEVKRRSR